MLGRQYERTNEMNVLDDATDAARKAAQSTPRDYKDRAICLNAYAISLARLYERNRQAKDLDEAIDNARQAVQVTTSDYAALGKYLTNLGNMLGDRYGHIGEIIYLEQAIETARHALQSILSNHPEYAACLNNLGTRLWKLYEQTRQMKDLEEASQCYLQAFETIVARPLERVQVAARYLDKSASLCRPHEGVKLGRAALTLLSTAHTRNLDENDQQFVLSGFAGIASDLCALLISESQLQEAVECLEQGRTVIISRLLDDRSDFTRLSQAQPQLGQRYQSLLTQVNAPFDGTKHDAVMNMKLSRRREATKELETCLEDIRATPAGEHFLLGQTFEQMQENMSEGYIVLVDISTIRSDALVMTRDNLKAIPLLGLDVEDARRWLRTDWKSKNSELREKNDEFIVYLTWLWQVCVRHILDCFSTLCRGEKALSRV
ncbi:hypothetical protein KCV07_g10139, partial [Aureobasidium melanogenum]